MIITNEKSLEFVQEEFHQRFPFLKLEFYTNQHQSGHGSPIGETLDSSLLIKQVRKQDSDGNLNIDPTMKVSELELALFEEFGLNAQVFRRSGNIWIQTSFTDNWSLEKQNRKGESSEKHFQEMHRDN
jgi:hypothetical protein